MTTDLDALLDFSDSDAEDAPDAETVMRMRAYLEAAAVPPAGVAPFCGDLTAEWRSGDNYKGYHVRLHCDGAGEAKDYIYYVEGGESFVQGATPENLAERLKPLGD